MVCYETSGVVSGRNGWRINGEQAGSDQGHRTGWTVLVP